MKNIIKRIEENKWIINHYEAQIMAINFATEKHIYRKPYHDDTMPRIRAIAWDCGRVEEFDNLTIWTDTEESKKLAKEKGVSDEDAYKNKEYFAFTHKLKNDLGSKIELVARENDFLNLVWSLGAKIRLFLDSYKNRYPNLENLDLETLTI